MRKSTAFALLAILLAAAWIRLSPLLSSLYWGSDIGEYFFLFRSLATHGLMPTSYAGWGATYPDFPGMFLVQDAFASLGGVDLPTVLNLLVPVLAALAVLPAFLLATQLTSDRRVGLFAAAFLASVMPAVYPTSHTAPASLGDLLVLSCLVLFLRLGRDPKAFAPLVLVSGALVLTHHLSTYFLIVMVLGTIVLRGLLRPLADGPGVRREVAYAAFLVAATFAFWFGSATAFSQYILTDVNVQPWWLVLVAFGLVIALAAGVLLARNRVAWRYRPAYPDLRHSVRVYAAGAAFVLAFTAYGTVAAIPGTGVSLAPAVFVGFLPFFLLVSLAASGRKFYDFLRGGVAPTAWFAALGASALIGTVVATRVLIPYRHVEYLVIPLALFAGLGVARLADLGGLVGARRLAASGLVGALLVGQFAMAIPPPNLVANWDEGTHPAALDGAYWARGHVRGLVLADHAASTILFGFGSVDGTWDTTSTPYFASKFAQAEPGLVDVLAPSGRGNVSYVFVDKTEAAGVQLKPWDPAVPMPAATTAMFSNAPFVKVFDSGYAQVYWIDWGCTSGSCS